MANIPEFKLVLVGEPNVGKSVFLKRHLTGEFVREYIASTHTDVQCVQFFTSRGPVRFQIWDVGVEDTSSKSEGAYLHEADCAILMYDLTSLRSYIYLRSWHRAVNKTCGAIPIVVCGSKRDVDHGRFKKTHVTFQRKKGLPHYELSSKTFYNMEAPFLRLARLLLNDSELSFVSICSGCVPPSIDCVSPEQMAKWQAELKEAQKVPLPDDDL